MRTVICASILLFAACAAPVTEIEDTGLETASSFDAAETETEDTPMPESPPEPPKPDEQPAQPTYQKTPEGVAGLPGSDGKTFSELDEYLAHLEVKGHTDRPFWELMEDGRYRWNTGRGMQFKEPKYATREDLLEKYGFSE